MNAAAPVVLVQQFAVVVPASTPVANPQVTQAQLPGIYVVEWIELKVPPGPRGEVGFYIASSLTQIVPFRTGATANWLILDNDEIHWDMTDQPDSGDWQIVAYNTGNYDHTLWVRFGLNLAPDPAPPPLRVGLLDATNLSGVAGGA